jgi:hypothetical protein
MSEKCAVCGEPMAPEESMFKFHGSLGPCPKPPLPRDPKPTYEELQSELEALKAERKIQDIRISTHETCMQQVEAENKQLKKDFHYLKNQDGTPYPDK